MRCLAPESDFPGSVVRTIFAILAQKRIGKEAPTPDRYDSRAPARTAILCPVADVAALVPSYGSMLLFGRARSAVHHPAAPARVLTMTVGLRDAEDVLT